MAIPHSLDAVIDAVQALIDGRPIPEDWKAEPKAPTAPDFSHTLFNILNQAEEAKMDRSEFESLPAAEKERILAEKLAGLSTKQTDVNPVMQAVSELRIEVAAVAARVGMIEAAILSAKGAG